MTYYGDESGGSDVRDMQHELHMRNAYTVFGRISEDTAVDGRIICQGITVWLWARINGIHDNNLERRIRRRFRTAGRLASFHGM